MLGGIEQLLTQPFLTKENNKDNANRYSSKSIKWTTRYIANH